MKYFIVACLITLRLSAQTIQPLSLKELLDSTLCYDGVLNNKDTVTIYGIQYVLVDYIRLSETFFYNEAPIYMYSNLDYIKKNNEIVIDTTGVSNATCFQLGLFKNKRHLKKVWKKLAEDHNDGGNELLFSGYLQKDSTYNYSLRLFSMNKKEFFKNKWGFMLQDLIPFRKRTISREGHFTPFEYFLKIEIEDNQYKIKKVKRPYEMKMTKECKRRELYEFHKEIIGDKLTEEELQKLIEKEMKDY